MTLTFDLWPWNSVSFYRLSRYTVMHPRVAAILHTQKHIKNFVWPWTSTYDLEIQQTCSKRCQATCLCNISSSWVQRFISYRVHREKKLSCKQYCRRFASSKNKHYQNAIILQHVYCRNIVSTYRDVGRGRCTWVPRWCASSRWRWSRRGQTQSRIHALYRQYNPTRSWAACNTTNQQLRLILSPILYNLENIYLKWVKGRKKSTALHRITHLKPTCHVWSHSVTCHQTQVNAPRLNPSQADWYSTYLQRGDGTLSWPWCSLYRHTEIVRKQSLI